MAKSRRLIDFPLSSVETQFARGLVKGLPFRERRLQREATDRHRQENFDFQADQAEAQRDQDTKKAIWGFITGPSFKLMTPQAQEQILRRVQDQGFSLPIDLPSVALGQTAGPTAPPSSLGVAHGVPRQPALGRPPSSRGVAGGLPGQQPTTTQPTTPSFTPLFRQPDPIFEEAKRRRAQDVLDAPTVAQEAQQDVRDATAKAAKDTYRAITSQAKEIATDDALDPTDRVTAIKGLGLRTGDEKRWIARAKIKRRPTKTTPPSMGSLLRSIAALDNQIALETNLAKIDWNKEQRAILVAQLEEVKRRMGIQGQAQQPKPPPPKPTTPPLKVENAPTAEKNKNTPDSIKRIEQWKLALPADERAKAEHFVKEGKTTWELLFQRGNP